MKLYHISTKFRYNKEVLHAEFYTFSSCVKKAKEKAWNSFYAQYKDRIGLSYKKFIINSRVRNYKSLIDIIRILWNRLMK